MYMHSYMKEINKCIHTLGISMDIPYQTHKCRRQEVKAEYYWGSMLFLLLVIKR